MKAPALCTSVNSVVGAAAAVTLAQNSTSSSFNGSSKSNSSNNCAISSNINKSSSDDPNTNWQHEMLMERLRTKASASLLRPLLDSTKNMRQFILNKQHLMDGSDRISASSCLDDLQQNIPVTSLEAMVERLEATSRQLGLKFTASPIAIGEVYISCDMFYVEVLLDRGGATRDVRVEFAGESTNIDNSEPGQSCPELIDCLSRCDFKEFTTHLKGFLAMYTLSTSDKKAKLQTQYALKALETDLSKLFALAEETIGDLCKLVLKSPVGLLLPRRGGHSMRLVYFISPYELLDTRAGRSLPLTPSTVRTLEFGQHAQLHIISSTTLHKLQHTTLMQTTKGSDGKTLPSFSGLTSSNSTAMQSVFALKLPKPLPLSLTLAKCIADITGITLQDITGTDVTEAAGAIANSCSYRQLLELVVLQASEDKISPSFLEKGLNVTLPDQQHCYYFPTQGCHFPGMLVNSIPFTHPTHITSILVLLRAQAAFNTLIASCVRPNSKQDADSAYMFEVTSLSHEFISVTFEHPQDESTATAEIELTDLCNIRCRLHTLAANPANGASETSLCSDEFATKVLQRCLSIPVTMRAVMRKAMKEDVKDMLPQCGDSVVMSGMPSSGAPADFTQNNKFVMNDYDRRGGAARASGSTMGTGQQIRVASSTSPVVGQQRPAGGGASPAMTQRSSNAAMGGNFSASSGTSISSVGSTVASGPALGNNFSTSKTPNLFPNLSYTQVKTEPSLEKAPFSNLLPSAQKTAISQHHFLDDVKAVKVRKRKVMDVDRKGGGGMYGDDVIELDDPLRDPLEISETKPDVDKMLAYGVESSRRKMDKLPPSYEASTDTRNRRDGKMEKLQHFLAKRRASNDSTATTASSSALSDAGSCDLAALRDQVYGPGSASTFAQFNLVPSDDHITPDGRDITKKSKKARINEPQVVEARKSPIVLDLTESDNSTRKSSNSSSGRISGGTSTSSSSAVVNSSTLLKRPGIEIFPIPGAATPISIPSSITVTPVIKSSSSSSLAYSSDDRSKERKDRKDRKDSDKKDKKRRREDSPSSSSSSKSKVQVMSNSLKHSSSLPSMDKFRSDSSNKSSSSNSGLSSKPNTPPYQSPSKNSSNSKLSSSPNISKSSSSQHSSKLTYSPTHKSSSSNSGTKTIYSPSQSQHHGSSNSSPKPAISPKQQGLSPKLSSSGKPSLNALKTSTSSPSSSSKSSLSPKNASGTTTNSSSMPVNCSSSSSSSVGNSGISKNTSSSGSSNTSGIVSSISSSQYGASKERSSSSSPARAQVSGLPNILSSSSSSSLPNSSSKPKSSSNSANISNSGSTSSSDKSKSSNFADTLPKPPISSTTSSGQSFFVASNSSVANALHDKASFLLDKAKASPPKNRKGSCLSDIVDKLRAGVSGSTDPIVIGETCNDRKEITKVGAVNDLKKDPDKKNDYTLKPLDGLKLSFNKSKSKELKENQIKSSNMASVSPNSKLNKSTSGLKPGVVSGPASKKVSMSNLPPIPKLNSSTNINSTASVSPLASPLVSAASSSSSSYNSVAAQQGYFSHYKERVKEKPSSYDKTSSCDRPRLKDMSSLLSSPSTLSSKSNSDARREPSGAEKHLGGSVNSSNSSSNASSCASNATINSAQSVGKCKDDFRADSLQSKKASDGDSRSNRTGYQKSSESSECKESSYKGTSVSNKPTDMMSSSGSSMLISLLTGQSPPTNKSNESFRQSLKSGCEENDTKSGLAGLEYSATIKLSSANSSLATKLSSSSGDDSCKLNEPEKLVNHVNSAPTVPETLKSSGTSSIILPKACLVNNSNSIASSNAFNNSTSLSAGRAVPLKVVPSSDSLPPPPPPPPPKPSISPSANCVPPPLSPSVSIKIVKSPAPASSPLNMISPLSMSSQQSPCIIDDDLMDEALMGPRK
ncbi:serine-rich adhesin for platelets [Hyalella azteca]|uniref:Mediator of RNA polymerase II transcription subunit 1 n=1 Tax=Hyalella azteca TaxID=294128 RepID=A0A8B7NR17_HYAAZ|nr:serine-rich adhesin for platelets [Hyalella azteca]